MITKTRTTLAPTAKDLVIRNYGVAPVEVRASGLTWGAESAAVRVGQSSAVRGVMEGG